MDDNNHNHANNPYFQGSPHNQVTPNNVQIDPNFFNTPQGQLMFQMFNNQMRANYVTNNIDSSQVPNNNPHFLLNQSQQPQILNKSNFDISLHINQPNNYSPGGGGSSNTTPSEDVRCGQQLDGNHGVVAQLFPDDTRSSKIKWGVKDDEALVSAYLHAGGDNKKGTGQSKGDLWKTILRLYNEALEDASFVIQPRTLKALASRWDIINRDVSRWVGVYAQAQRNKASGRSEEDVENDAHHLYQQKYNGVNFTLMHAWKEMRHMRKWQTERMELPSESGDSSKRSQPDTPTDESVNPRPEGIKKAKKKGKQMASSSVNIDVFTSAISEMNVNSSRREQLGIQMLDYQRERDAAKIKQKEEDRQWQLFMLLLSKTNLDPQESFMLAKLKEKYNYMFD